jgi:hypothetical protein
MKLLDSILDKCYIKQWTYGLCNINDRDVLVDGIDGLNFHWASVPKPTRFFADPFIFKTQKGEQVVIYEDYDNDDQYGKVSVDILNPEFSVKKQKTILDTKLHLSYPNVIHQNGKIYIMPESSKEGDLCCYEYDEANHELINKKVIIPNSGLLDSTILFYNNKYWLFATKRGNESNATLYIYFSDTWDGNYQSHPLNPVKSNLKGSRPAGNFIFKDGSIYRPTQNSADYYGKSIIINKIEKLDELHFEEKPFKELFPLQNTRFNFAIHTINISDGVIVVDGLRKIFNPLAQIKIFLFKRLKLNLNNK